MDAQKLSARFIYFYATLLTLCSFAFMFYAAFLHDYAARPGSEQVINTVLGFLLGVAVSSVVQYFFGSSAGSKAKDEQLAKQADDLGDAAARR